jgi:hypothetical protein
MISRECCLYTLNLLIVYDNKTRNKFKNGKYITTNYNNIIFNKQGFPYYIFVDEQMLS